MLEKKKINLFALLVGINNYAHVKGLSGCINDVANIEQYLKSRPSLEADIETLIGREATKQGVVQKIISHLGKAKEGDTAMFYFAGHGLLESTSVLAFQKAGVGDRLESLVCYDSNPFNEPEGGKVSCLADKEIRYLLAKMSKNNPHLVLVFDCCHSDSASRHSPNLEQRRASLNPIPERAWDGFIFQHEIPRKELEEKTLDEVMPLAGHVQMAACRDVEVAWEYTENGKTMGVFTTALMKILGASEKTPSYYQLNKHINNFMRGWAVQKQTPQCYPISKDPHLLFRTFLGGEIQQQAHRSEIVWNPQEGWILPLGKIHGLTGEDAGNPFPVFVHGRKSSKDVYIQKVNPGYCLVVDKNPPALSPGPGQSYPCEVQIPIPPMSIFIKGGEKEKRRLEDALKKKIKESKSSYVKLADEAEEADYTLWARPKECIISLPNDNKALVAPIPIDLLNAVSQPKSVDLLCNYLEQIAQWNFLLDASPRRTSLHSRPSEHYTKYPVELKLYQQNPDTREKKEIRVDQGCINLDLEYQTPAGQPYNQLVVHLINHSHLHLYCSLLYLSMNFEADASLLPGNGCWLSPGDDIYALEGNPIVITNDSYIVKDNWPGTREFLKLFICTEQFDVEPLLLKGLPIPDGQNRGLATSRAFKFKGFSHPRKDWTCWNTEFFINNHPQRKLPTENP
ncbi:MAG: caspase family protein [Lewinellaceae bacterium]|nr:caspase family protein [Lewinellaceae bacterium]